MGLLSEIKKDAKKSGQNKGKFIYFKEGTKLRIRFLQDMERSRRWTRIRNSIWRSAEVTM